MQELKDAWSLLYIKQKHISVNINIKHEGNVTGIKKNNLSRTQAHLTSSSSFMTSVCNYQVIKLHDL